MNVDPQLLRSILEIAVTRKRLSFVEPERSNAFLETARLLWKAGMITGVELQDDLGWNLLEPELTELGSRLREQITNPADWIKLNAQAPLWTRESGAEMLKEWQRRQVMAV